MHPIILAYFILLFCISITSSLVICRTVQFNPAGVADQPARAASNKRAVCHVHQAPTTAPTPVPTSIHVCTSHNGAGGCGDLADHYCNENHECAECHLCFANHDAITTECPSTCRPRPPPPTALSCTAHRGEFGCNRGFAIDEPHYCNRDGQCAACRFCFTRNDPISRRCPVSMCGPPPESATATSHGVDRLSKRSTTVPPATTSPPAPALTEPAAHASITLPANRLPTNSSSRFTTTAQPTPPGPTMPSLLSVFTVMPHGSTDGCDGSGSHPALSTTVASLAACQQAEAALSLSNKAVKVSSRLALPTGCFFWENRGAVFWNDREPAQAAGAFGSGKRAICITNPPPTTTVAIPVTAADTASLPAAVTSMAGPMTATSSTSPSQGGVLRTAAASTVAPTPAPASTGLQPPDGFAEMSPGCCRDARDGSGSPLAFADVGGPECAVLCASEPTCFGFEVNSDSSSCELHFEPDMFHHTDGESKCACWRNTTVLQRLPPPPNFQLSSKGYCTHGTTRLETFVRCAMGAQRLGLGGKGTTTKAIKVLASAVLPPGCFVRPNSPRVFFNTAAGSSSHANTRQSICLALFPPPTAAPINPPTASPSYDAAAFQAARGRNPGPNVLFILADGDPLPSPTPPDTHRYARRH